jgi:alpha-amylase
MKKIPLLVLSSLLLVGCSQNTSSSFSSAKKETNILDDNYRNYYEIFVSSFADGNNDGIGDLKGITSKLSYLSNIGYTGIWLTPIFTSPSYHKYDVQDHFTIDSDFGTLDDLKELVQVAHSLNMKVLLDGVFNHSSNLNSWFNSSLLAHRKKLLGESLTEEEKEYDSLYSYVDSKEEMKSDRKYEKAGANDFYYECNFSSSMPEFNFESEFTYTKIKAVIDYYMSDEIGIDGFRLDAVLYYDYHNTEKNVIILNRIAKMIHDHDGYVVGECFADEKTITDYYESDVDSFFYFPAQGNNGFIVSSIGFQGQNKMKYLENEIRMIKNASSHIPAPFLDNHDVSRVSRSGNMRQHKFLLGLRDMLNGSTFNYYGDEIGMSSLNLDTNSDYLDSSYRTHYYWDDETHGYETNDPSHALKQEETYPDSKTQLGDYNSILNYEKKALKLRNTYPSIARGKISVDEDDMKINQDDERTLLLILEKEYQDEKIKIIFNFSSLESYTYEMKDYKLEDTLLSDMDDKEKVESNTLTLPPYSVAILKR